MSSTLIPLAIIGPTAVGKSALAMAVAAAEPRVEIISADSMQVYRGMDIGTAKPTAGEQAAVRHHLIDMADPHEDYTVSEFAKDVAVVAETVREAGRMPILVGGTGLYVRSIVDSLDIPGRFPDARAAIEAEADTEALHKRLVDLDPTAAARTEPTNRRRVVRALEVTIGSGRPFSSYGPGMDVYGPTRTRQIGCDRPRPVLDERIDLRYKAQMSAGFLEEVRTLTERPKGLSRTARQALGYKELLSHIEDGAPLDQALDLANQRTRRFARRQQRWFRRDPRIDWIDMGSADIHSIVAKCIELLRYSQ